MLLRVEAPLRIVGDTHGQFYDLLKIFSIGGHPPRSRYLFLGDYVDRSDMGVEVMLMLMCYKVCASCGCIFRYAFSSFCMFVLNHLRECILST